MGTSHPETKPWIIKKIMSLPPPVSILDIGAGAGVWCDQLRAANFIGPIYAIEVWEPYIEQFDLGNKYNLVYHTDARDWKDFYYDVVILGDVLEHMTKLEAMQLVDRIGSMANYIAIALPIVHYPQGALNDNPYEVHVKDNWSNAEMLGTFPQIVDSQTYSMTGAYWLDCAILKRP